MLKTNKTAFYDNLKLYICNDSFDEFIVDSKKINNIIEWLYNVNIIRTIRQSLKLLRLFAYNSENRNFMF